MLENNGHYTEGTDTIQGGDGQYSRGETDSIKDCKGGDRHFTRGTDPMQWVGCQTLCKGWRMDIIQGGDVHYTRGDGH